MTIFDFIWRLYEVAHAVSSLSTATSLNSKKTVSWGSSIVGIGYLLHMKTKNRIYCLNALVFSNITETVPYSRLCFAAMYSLATHSLSSFHYVTGLLLLTCLPLWEVTRIRPPSCLVVFEIFLVVWGPKICFDFRGCAPELLLVLSGLRCFCVRLFWQRHEAFLLSSL